MPTTFPYLDLLLLEGLLNKYVNNSRDVKVVERSSRYETGTKKFIKKPSSRMTGVLLNQLSTLHISNLRLRISTGNADLREENSRGSMMTCHLR